MLKVRNLFHPGEILEEEFLKPKGLSQSELARALGTTHAVINLIFLGKRRISAAMALKLAKYFKMNHEFWMNLQVAWDLRKEWKKHKKKVS